MSVSYAKTAVAELVSQQPARAKVFERAGIDFCCGGKQVLSEVCRRKRIDLDRLCRELTNCDSTSSQFTDISIDWRKSSIEDLIDHIIKTHHDYLRKEFPRLIKLMDKVLRVHSKNHPELAELRRVLSALEAELFTHMLKEEQILFPGIKQFKHESFDPDRIGGRIQVMESEHFHVREALSRIHWLTDGYTPPTDSCASFRLLLSSLKNLEEDLHLHIHKENNILFPKVMEYADYLSLGA